MINRSRPWLRRFVAVATCALVAAPALIASTSVSPVAAAPPGVPSSTLTVGGAGTGLPWQLYTAGYYDQLTGALTNQSNFGPSGIVKKGKYVVSPTPITTALSFPGTLSGLDVFFGGIPNGEYSAGEITALQNFNADGRALVLNANAPGFGDITQALGFSLRGNRAFFGGGDVTACGWDNSAGVPDADAAPARSTVVGGQAANPIVAGPFGTASTVANYHTVEVFNGGLPAGAQALYSINVAGQAPQLYMTGPIGETTSGTPLFTHVSYQAAYVTGNISLTTAALTPSGILSVDFYHDAAGVVGNLIGSSSSYPYSIDWNTAALAPVGVADGLHNVIAHVTRTVAAGGGTFDVPLQFQVNVHNTAPTPPVNTTNVSLDCPGASDLVDNNISGTTVAYIPPGALSANSGPVVVTTDLDSMSNAFNSSWAENQKFALNSFAWIMDKMLPDVPDDTYFPLPTPVRVIDSRQGTALQHDSSRDIQVAGLLGIPADAKTVLANVTVVDPDSSGYFTVYPTGQARPVTSTHNFTAGENFANMIAMQVGAGGNISVYDFLDGGPGNEAGVIVDVIGYTRRDNSGSRLHTMDPARLLDTRRNDTGLPQGPFGPGATQDLTVRGGSTGVPSDADSVVLNMTATNATATGSFLTVWPSGTALPTASNINLIAGVARPNLVVARIGSNGKVSIRNDSGSVDVLADVVGYFSPGAFKSGGVITGLTPSRILDTRNPGDSAFAANSFRSIQILGAGNPAIPGTAKTAILKVTAVSPTGGGFLTVWPSGTTTPPVVSNLNFLPNMTIPNLVITRIGSDGKVNIYNSAGSTHVIVDILGYAD